MGTWLKSRQGRAGQAMISVVFLIDEERGKRREFGELLDLELGEEGRGEHCCMLR